MNVYFVSDNCFFLHGISLVAKEYRREINVQAIFSKNVPQDFSPSEDDMVVLNIWNVMERSRIARSSVLLKCRVLIGLNISGTQEYNSRFARHFPWSIPRNLRKDELFLYLRKAKEAVLDHKSFTDNEARLFNYLADGLSVPELASTFNIGLTSKYIYTLKRKVILRNKLQGHDASAIIACRDIIGLSQSYYEA